MWRGKNKSCVFSFLFIISLFHFCVFFFKVTSRVVLKERQCISRGITRNFLQRNADRNTFLDGRNKKKVTRCRSWSDGGLNVRGDEDIGCMCGMGCQGNIGWLGVSGFGEFTWRLGAARCVVTCTTPRLKSFVQLNWFKVRKNPGILRQSNVHYWYHRRRDRHKHREKIRDLEKKGSKRYRGKKKREKTKKKKGERDRKT